MHYHVANKKNLLRHYGTDSLLMQIKAREGRMLIYSRWDSGASRKTLPKNKIYFHWLTFTEESSQLQK